MEAGREEWEEEEAAGCVVIMGRGVEERVVDDMIDTIVSRRQGAI